MKKHISIVIPAYNETKSLKQFLTELLDFIDNSLPQYHFEIIVINDGSKDTTRNTIINLHQQDSRIVWYSFSRNFGKEIALSAWLEKAKGDAIITIDADGQHPLSKLPEFIKRWEDWYDIVYNKRPYQQGASFFKRVSSSLFYRFFNTLSEFKLEPWTTDYRLLSRNVVDAFNTFEERTRLFRWIIDRIGFNRKELIFDSQYALDADRNPSYNYKKLFGLALDALTSFSITPLKLVWIFGLLVIIASSLSIAFALIDMIFLHKFGITNLGLFTAFNTLLIGIVMFALGIIAYYIATIHKETKARPLYIIQKSTDMI